jgi:hypothetical protein
MRVRADSVFISSILHTIALLYFVHLALWYYGAGLDRAALERLDDGYRAEAQADHYLGVACLAIILIGLIVVWTGYVRRSRAAWLVVFVIAWFWAFPVFILPYVVPLARGKAVFTFPELLYDAISGPGWTRFVARLILIFLLMVIALAMPLGRFFIARKANEPVHLPSRRVAASLLIGIPVVAIALYCWLRVGVLYEIPNATFLVVPPPPPPPPPSPCKCDERN